MSRSTVVRLCVAVAVVVATAATPTRAGQLASRPPDAQIRSLENASRVAAQRVDEILARLDLREGQVVADIGAGTGVFARPLARTVGPAGRVYAVDIVPELLAFLDDRSRQEQITNIQSVLGVPDDPKLPAQNVDVALFNDVLHHIEHRAEYLRALAAYMKPDSLIAIVEFDNRGNREQRVEGVPMVDKAELTGWLAEIGYRPIQEYTDLFVNKWYAIYGRGVVQLTRHATPPPLQRSTPAPTSRQPDNPQLTSGTGGLSGIVIDRATQEPLPDATVRISPDGGRTGRSVATAPDGTFYFDRVPAGTYYITSTKGGYALGAYSRTDVYVPGAPSYFELDEGEDARGVSIQLAQDGVVRGIVLSASGSPVSGAPVQLKRLTTLNGKRLLTLGPRATTGSDGRYEAAAVPPGTYVVTLPTTLGRTWSTVYHPDTLSADDAKPIDVADGEVTENRDLRIPASPTVSVSGRVVGLGPATTGVTVDLIPDGPDIVTDVPIALAAISPDGTFEFSGVAAGRYELRVRSFPPVQSQPGFIGGTQTSSLGGGGSFSGGGRTLSPMSELPTLWAVVPLTVARTNVENVEVPLNVAARIRGRVVFEGTTQTPDASALNGTGVLVRPDLFTDLPRFQLARIESDGMFVTAGLPPGSYGLTALPNVGGDDWLRTWTLEAVTIGGRRASGVDLDREDVSDVTLTYVDNPGTLSGVVRDAAGAFVPGARVHIFPREPETLPVRRPLDRLTLAASRRAAFETKLPSGEYFIIAVSSTTISDDEIETLARQGNAARVRRGERLVIDLVAR